MRVLLAFLIWGLCAQSASLPRYHLKPIYHEWLRELNEFRAKYAEAAQVSNMNHLTYDKELAKVARFLKQNDSCFDESTLERLDREAHYACYKNPLEEDFVEYTALHRNDTEGLNNFFGNEDLFRSVLHPKVEKVGCSFLRSYCVLKISSRAAIFTNVKRSTVRVLCIFRPKDHFTPDDPFYGKPGSHCSGEVTNRGLCKVTNKTKSNETMTLAMNSTKT
ncbi:hypothetical protein GCK72_012520 [Caenorhabditis remanei]|uniref:SCP domain-containing protein n=1 Tax=Caenorhabditis remanei TaxID=31234 RepID=A0A6A5GL55_CAERE|nr:hypothetical protein GCK72_012520 [Caenorhabditis remanei]KAF1756067.1 hypothetical protein GCK72_012520 [Caenorhabditis remanei]